MTKAEAGALGAAALSAQMTQAERSERARKAVLARWSRTTPRQRSAIARKLAQASAKARKRKAA
jgi:hypothetical protein